MRNEEVAVVEQFLWARYTPRKTNHRVILARDAEGAEGMSRKELRAELRSELAGVRRPPEDRLRVEAYSMRTLSVYGYHIVNLDVRTGGMEFMPVSTHSANPDLHIKVDESGDGTWSLDVHASWLSGWDRVQIFRRGKGERSFRYAGIQQVLVD